MRSLFFHSGQNSVSEVRYGLCHSDDREDGLHGVDIVLVQSDRFRFGLSLINSDEAREDIVSRILDVELRGVPLNLVRVFFVLDFARSIDGTEFMIVADIEDYIARGNPAKIEEKRGLLGMGNIKERVITTHSFDVTAGSCKIISGFDEHRQMEASESLKRLKAVGYTPLFEQCPNH